MIKCEHHDYLYEDIKEIKADVKDILKRLNKKDGSDTIKSSLFIVFISSIVTVIGRLIKW